MFCNKWDAMGKAINICDINLIFQEKYHHYEKYLSESAAYRE